MVNMAELEKNDAEAKQNAAKAAEALRQGRQAQAGAEFPRILEAVKGYGSHWTKEQQRELGRELGLMPAKAQAPANGSKKPSKSKTTATPYYQLDSGETCSQKSGKFKKEWAGALNAAIAEVGGKRENLPLYPNPNAPKAAAKSAGKATA